MPKLSDRTQHEAADGDLDTAGTRAEMASDERERAPARRGLRRRRQIGNRSREASPEAVSDDNGRRKVKRPSQWNHNLAHFGPFIAFRPYLFVAGVLVILAFLLYNESIIADFGEQENDQVNLLAQLYALGVSSNQADQELTAVIFDKVISAESKFPIVITDYSGEIIFWKGAELPDQGDRSPESMALLREFLQRMDARREPIELKILPETDGLLHYGADGFAITSLGGAIAGWQGADLPADDDTAGVAAQAVREAVGNMDRANKPRSFTVASGSFSRLHYKGTDFVITDEKGESIVTWWGNGLPERGDRTEAAVDRIREIMVSMDVENDPLTFQIPSEAVQYLHYGDSDTVSRISWANFSLMSILILFLLVGFVGFRNIRRSEQRSIWVGMAKETAHQLGTPLSSVSGWLELIRGELQREAPADPVAAAERLESIDGKVAGMEQDLKRLNQIALRFSQIGSVPELEMTDINTVLGDTVEYFQSRGPQFGQVDLIHRRGGVPEIPLNRELISWAFENLCKNGIDAIGNKPGRIVIGVVSIAQKGLVQITVQDNGRGIEPDHVDQVFEPGFSTKKRGWGLGLAFVKRIIEEYHNGRIGITQSAPGEGTAFEVLLPIE